MRGDAGELVAYCFRYRGIDQDWRHLHDAAKAGRYDVVSFLHRKLNISVRLVNKRGRNILHAAIAHRRYEFIQWLSWTGPAGGWPENLGYVRLRRSNSNSDHVPPVPRTGLNRPTPPLPTTAARVHASPRCAGARQSAIRCTRRVGTQALPRRRRSPRRRRRVGDGWVQ